MNICCALYHLFPASKSCLLCVRPNLIVKVQCELLGVSEKSIFSRWWKKCHIKPKTYQGIDMMLFFGVKMLQVSCTLRLCYIACQIRNTFFAQVQVFIQYLRKDNFFQGRIGLWERGAPEWAECYKLTFVHESRFRDDSYARKIMYLTLDEHFCE